MATGGGGEERVRIRSVYQSAAARGRRPGGAYNPAAWKISSQPAGLSTRSRRGQTPDRVSDASTALRRAATASMVAGEGVGSVACNNSSRCIRDWEIGSQIGDSRCRTVSASRSSRAAMQRRA